MSRSRCALHNHPHSKDGNFSPGKRLPNEQQRRSGPPTPRSQCPNRSGSAFPLTSARHQTGLCNAPHGRGSKHGNNEKKHKEERQRFALFEDSGRQLTPPMPRTISLLVIRRDVVVALDSKTQTFATLPAAICEGRQILPPPPRPRTQPIGLRYRYKNTIMAIHGQRIPRHSQPCTVSVSFSTTARTNPGKEESCNGLETRSGPSPIAFSPCFPPFSLWRAALARRKLGGQPVICAGTATHSSGSNRASRRPLVFRLRFAVLSSLSLSLSLSPPSSHGCFCSSNSGSRRATPLSGPPSRRHYVTATQFVPTFDIGVLGPPSKLSQAKEALCRARTMSYETASGLSFDPRRRPVAEQGGEERG
ncbi:hypothetical protein LY78DRAFT_338663 [Colletotrichum sublineola]|nr:hypothetical protein LY78DRAFT_338663 [Colletotrichum sublineola]